MARQIGKMLNAKEPKIVNGPEILNKYVGQSEENVRKLFADAEKEVSPSQLTYCRNIGSTKKKATPVISTLLSSTNSTRLPNNAVLRAAVPA